MRKSGFGGGKESDRMRAHDYEIKTERLLLRPMTVADADAVWKWVSDERVAKYMIYPVYTDMGEVREWLRSVEEFDGEYHFGYVRLSDNELIGSGSIGPVPKKKDSGDLVITSDTIAGKWDMQQRLQER